MGHNASKSSVWSYWLTVMMLVLNFLKSRNAEFPVGELNTCAAHDVTNDISIIE